jgi:hypothetical protein
MANPITDQTRTGTVGELLVQLRLLQYGVQAAPPLKDSGNDLVALMGFAIRCVQVKTSTSALPAWPPADKLYHLIAIVKLVGMDDTLRLDDSRVYLLSKEELSGVERSWHALDRFALDRRRVEMLFTP